MAAARLTVAAHQHIVRGIKEQDLIFYPLRRQLKKSFFDFFRRAAAADVHTESHPLELVVTRFRKRRDAGQQCRRDVINAEKADVFQCIHGDRFACTGKAADDEKIHFARLFLLCFHHTNFFFEVVAGLFLSRCTHLIAQSQHICTGRSTQIDHKAAVLVTDGCASMAVARRPHWSMRAAANAPTGRLKVLPALGLSRGCLSLRRAIRSFILRGCRRHCLLQGGTLPRGCNRRFLRKCCGGI